MRNMASLEVWWATWGPINDLEDKLCTIYKCKNCCMQGHILKLDGVGPVDNRPHTNKLHYIVKKKKVTCDM